MLADYAMALLVAVLGLRPLQVVCLKIGDLRPSSNPGVFVADLMVTRLKQKGGRRPREEFTAYGLVPALADVVHRQCAQATDQAARFGVAVPDAPLFPSQGRRDVALPGLVGHLSVEMVSRRIGRTFDRLGALRDRPGGGEHVFPLRLRRTLATILFGETAGLAEISILLDHTGAESALAYIEASPRLSPRLDAAMGVSFQELAARILHGGAAIEPGSDAVPRS